MDSYETNFLPFFLVTRTLIFSEQMIIVDVVNILFYFSVIRDSLKEIGVMRDRSPPPLPSCNTYLPPPQEGLVRPVCADEVHFHVPFSSD